MVLGSSWNSLGLVGISNGLVHNAHRIEMRGDSMRKSRGKQSG